MKTLLILYRPGDTDATTQAVLERLARRFGPECVDIGGDAAPRLHRHALDRMRDLAAGYCAVLAMIGPRWVGSADEGGRRLDDPNDVVRRTLATALTSKAILVVPMLVDGAEMPSAVDLPPDVLALAYRNATPVRLGQAFLPDMDKVILAILSFLPFQQRLSYPRLALFMTVALVFDLIFVFTVNLVYVTRANAHPSPAEVAAIGISFYVAYGLFAVGWWIGFLRVVRLRAWRWMVSFLLLGWSGLPMILFGVFGPRERRIPPAMT